VSAVLTLGVSVAAAASSWTVLSAALIRPVAGAAGRDVFAVASRSLASGRTGAGAERLGQTYTTYRTIEEAGVFSATAAAGTIDLVVATTSGARERTALFVSEHLFEVLRIRPELGRFFSGSDQLPGAALAVVLSDRLWRQEFGGEPGAIGRELRVGSGRATVIGVAPREFRGLDVTTAPEIYLPVQAAGAVDPNNWLAEPGRNTPPHSWLRVIGRLPPGVHPQGAASRLNALLVPATSQRDRFALIDLNAAAVPARIRPDLERFAALLGGAVGLLLILSGATLMTLLLIRLEDRRDDMATCLALGAPRRAVVHSVVAEGALLVAAGTMAGVPLAGSLLLGVRRLQLPGSIPIESLTLSPDPGVFVAIGAGLMLAIAGASAAIASRRVHGLTIGAARRDVRAGGGRRRSIRALIMVQIAIATVLACEALLLFRSLTGALHLDVHYDAAHVLAGRVTVASRNYSSHGAGDYFRMLSELLVQRPTVRSVAMAAGLRSVPTGGRLAVDDQLMVVPSPVIFEGIDDRYFRTVGLRILKGRDFSGRDDERAPRVGLVSESLGRLIAPGGDPIGRRIRDISGRPPAVIEVVGEVPDVILSTKALEPLAIYQPLAQVPDDQFNPFSRVVVARVIDSQRGAREMLTAMIALDPQVVVPEFTTLDDQIRREMAPQQLGSAVLGMLGTLAVVAALLTVYVLAEAVAQARQREMALRRVLGAPEKTLLWLALREGTSSVVVGLTAGLLLTAWFGRFTRSLLFGLDPLDAVTLTVVAGSIAVAGLGTSLIPALRHARADPGGLLREP
jgi:putative ABC transport system permease protein